MVAPCWEVTGSSHRAVAHRLLAVSMSAITLYPVMGRAKQRQEILKRFNHLSSHRQGIQLDVLVATAVEHNRSLMVTLQGITAVSINGHGAGAVSSQE